MSSLRASIASDHPDFRADPLDAQAWARLEALARASPLYGQMLRSRPDLCLWLEDDRNLRTAFRRRAFLDEWRSFREGPAGTGATADSGSADARIALLRRWRRQMSLRIAHRSVNGLADEPDTVAELSLLAELCIGECVAAARLHWNDLLGEPWDEAAGGPARFCVLALGKLGGGELNFSSDIDLIYCYEGDGACRRGGERSPSFNVEYFTKVAETATRHLSTRTADGFLFRVDVRLRPEGAWGPLVHSFSAIENYYTTGGQTWERLALIKARPVAGDLALGAELLEDLHAFRYPRRPPLSLLAEVAAMKTRTEREVVGADAIGRDIKRGPGGIREIEFIAQSLQLLHAGRYPFLQTPVTVAALERLARYELVGTDDAKFLTEAYWSLRRIEHRLQMRDEHQTHEIPKGKDELAELAASLGFPDPKPFLDGLASTRSRVHALYDGLFSDRRVDADFEGWWEFFTTERTPEPAAARIARWFGPVPGAAAALRRFACGDQRVQVTRELVTRFQHLAAGFDGLMPELARPLETLSRIARFAERYGTRQQFLNACASNPQLLRAVALLCDRSTYGVELLCAHPEILDEVLRPEMLRRRKLPRDLAVELAEGIREPGAARDWLWLYVRAEELRYLICELLGYLDPDAVESALTQLADAVLGRQAAGSGLLLVALGKYGGEELTFGSDLDLIAVAEDGAEAAGTRAVEALRGAVQRGGPLGPAFALDLRLRPHGDAGPLATTLPALRAYHEGPSTGAQAWERQVLLRARVAGGPPGLAASFAAWVEGLLYAAPISREDEAGLWAMRARIERERSAGPPAGRSFKTGAGGMIDIEFLAQALQLRHGHAHPELRAPGTRTVLRALGAAGLIPGEDAARLLDNFAFLKKVEFALRRDANQGVSALPASEAEREPLARWLGFAGEPAFWSEHLGRLRETRRIVRKLGGPLAESSLGS